MRENLKNFTLLYAEDDKAIQKEMLEYFSSYFKEVFTANDGKEALEIYKQNRPDVMILDNCTLKRQFTFGSHKHRCKLLFNKTSHFEKSKRYA